MFRKFEEECIPEASKSTSRNMLKITSCKYAQGHKWKKVRCGTVYNSKNTGILQFSNIHFLSLDLQGQSNDFGLSHMTCFGQWDINSMTQDILQMDFWGWLAFLHLCQYCKRNIFWIAQWSKKDEKHIEQPDKFADKTMKQRCPCLDEPNLSLRTEPGQWGSAESTSHGLQMQKLDKCSLLYATHILWLVVTQQQMTNKIGNKLNVHLHENG